MTIIETPRLLLRHWKETDLPTFAAMNADAEVMRFFPETYDEQRTKELYDVIQEEFAARGYGLYAAEERESGAFIGFIGFHWATFDADFCPCLEIGWRLGKASWNKGYATEGARACLKYGFSQLGFEAVTAFTAELNKPSQRVMQKIGMRFLEAFAHPEVPADHPLKPHVRYIIEKNDM